MTTTETSPFDYAGRLLELRVPGKMVLAGVSLFALVVVLSFAFLWHDAANLHVVEAGALYRSGELNGAVLEATIVQDGIKSVINLEGARPGRDWYEAERALSQQHGIAHYDFPLHATSTPSPAQVNALVDLMRSAPKPMLVHCRSGADRAGLAAALYLSKLRHRDIATAEAQLSWRYGHFPYLGSATRAMDDAFTTARSP